MLMSNGGDEVGAELRPDFEVKSSCGGVSRQADNVVEVWVEVEVRWDCGLAYR